MNAQNVENLISPVLDLAARQAIQATRAVEADDKSLGTTVLSRGGMLDRWSTNTPALQR